MFISYRTSIVTTTNQTFYSKGYSQVRIDLANKYTYREGDNPVYIGGIALEKIQYALQLDNSLLSIYNLVEENVISIFY